MRAAVEKTLRMFGQEHLIEDLCLMTEDELQSVSQQLGQWPIEQVQAERQSWEQRECKRYFEPFEDLPAVEKGPAKKAAVLILAGGSGSRLGAQLPKGCFPLLGKSLFERHCSKLVHQEVLLACMTSTINHLETVLFFEKNDFFGLKRVPYFFSQGTMPLLDEEGRWFWEGPGRVAEGPDGNGSVFAAFEEAGLGDLFEREGIEAVHVVNVDNPLADPLDPELAAVHAKSDVSIKCIRLERPEEPMGRLVRVGSQLAIAEFAELTEEQKKSCLLANSGLLAIDLSLMRQLAAQELPLHWAYKNTAVYSRGEISKRFAWKAERFVIDALFFAKQSSVCIASRKDCYAPLKDLQSIFEIERLLLERESRSMVSS